MDSYSNNSNIDYVEYRDDTPSLYLSVNESENDSSSFRSIDLQNSTHNTHSIWTPNFDNSWNFGQPKRKSYYDTDKISDSIEDTRTILKKNMNRLNERQNKIDNIDSVSELLLQNSKKFNDKSKGLRKKECYKYLFHSIGIVLIIILIITLILILLKS